MPPTNLLRRARQGFTLIEIMVVVLILSILMGVTFRLIGVSSNAAARADTIAKMERIHSALGAFYAEYGYYPPSSYWDVSSGEAGYCYTPVAYVMPIPKSSEDAANAFGTRIPAGGGDEQDMQFGLVSYLVPRLSTTYTAGGDDCFPDETKRRYKTAVNLSGMNAKAQSWTEAYRYEISDPRTAVCDRWKPHLADILYPNWDSPPHVGVEKGTSFWRPGARDPSGRQECAGVYRTIRDGWRNDFWYCCEPPFQSYTLLSTGPNGWKNPNYYINESTGKVTDKDVWNSFIIRTDK